MVSAALMAAPGVGPVAALSFMTASESPSRFHLSHGVAVYFGLSATLAVRLHSRC